MMARVMILAGKGKKKMKSKMTHPLRFLRTGFQKRFCRFNSLLVPLFTSLCFSVSYTTFFFLCRNLWPTPKKFMKCLQVGPPWFIGSTYMGIIHWESLSNAGMPSMTKTPPTPPSIGPSLNLYRVTCTVLEIILYIPFIAQVWEAQHLLRLLRPHPLCLLAGTSFI